MPGRQITFPPFRLDLAEERLWRDEQPIRLRPKTFAVLRYLVERPGQLVTNIELLQAVWADVVVDEAMPRLCIRELRQAFADDVRQPRFIETQPRRGYRFIAPITTAPLGVSSQYSVASRQEADAGSARILTQDSGLGTPHSALVGRETELAKLHQWLAKALHGERQLVFVTGEPGIGKTTLVEAFLAQSIPDGDPWIAQGQCIEHYGAGEPYLPVLAALGRLCRAPGGKRLIELLAHHAPTWLVQMPAVLTETALEALQCKTAGATKARMLRELAEAVEVLTAERTLVLWLEDLHWCDPSTLEWLSFLARRGEPARLLVLGSYRPGEAIARVHPLWAVKQELHMHGQCQELALGLLSEAAVEKYLAVRFPVGTTGRSPHMHQGNELTLS